MYLPSTNKIGIFKFLFNYLFIIIINTLTGKECTYIKVLHDQIFKYFCTEGEKSKLHYCTTDQNTVLFEFFFLSNRKIFFLWLKM